MKKLLFLSLFLSGAASFSQTLEGVNLEHLVATGRQTSFAKSNAHAVQRIRLTTGVEVDYVEQGDPSAVPVIFLHGLTDSWHSFESTLENLPPSVHAFAITQRGHGDSERPPEGYTPKDFAADVAAFIRQKNLGPAVIVGHSMGGIHTQQFVLDYPQLAKAIVIVGAAPVLSDNPGMQAFYNDILKLEGALSFDFMTGFQKSTLARPIDSAYYKLLVEEGTKTPVRVFQAAFAGLMNVNFRQRLKNIQCPALIVWGDKDAFFFRKGQDLFKAAIKNSKLLVYEGAGHALHWEEPRRFANDLIRFIKTNKL